MGNKYSARYPYRSYLPEWLEALDVSQAELARRLDTGKENVWRWINEPWRLTIESMSDIEHVLDLTPGALRRSPDEVLSEQEAMAALRNIKGKAPAG